MDLKNWLEKDDFSLALSAGFFSFYAHAGFVKALLEHNLKPQKYMGSSAGALLSALASTGYSMKEVEKILLQVRKADFWDLKVGLGLLKGDKFRKMLEKYLPKTFEELETPLTVAAHPLFGFKPVHFSTGDLISAVHASCCFPGMFHPVRINGSLFIDGGVTDWAGARSAGSHERILIHHIKPTGPHSPYIELQVKNLTRLNKNRRLITLPHLIEMGPDKMHLGLKAIEDSYQKTLSALHV